MPRPIARAALVACMVVGTAAWGQAPKPSKADIERAKSLFASADTNYKLGEYQKALDEFKEVYRLTSEPTLLYNIGQCQRQLGLLDDALKSYRSFLREIPGSNLQENVKERIQEIEAELAKRAQLGSIQVETNPEASAVTIDNKTKGASPFLLEGVLPGAHNIRVEKPGYVPYEITFELKPGQEFAIKLPLKEEKPAESAGFFQSKNLFALSVGTGSIAVLTGGAGVVLARVAATRQAEVASSFDALPNVAGANQGARVLGFTADGFWITTVLSATAAGILRYQEKKAQRESNEN